MDITQKQEEIRATSEKLGIPKENISELLNGNLSTPILNIPIDSNKDNSISGTLRYIVSKENKLELEIYPFVKLGTDKVIETSLKNHVDNLNKEQVLALNNGKTLQNISFQTSNNETVIKADLFLKNDKLTFKNIQYSGQELDPIKLQNILNKDTLKQVKDFKLEPKKAKVDKGLENNKNAVNSKSIESRVSIDPTFQLNLILKNLSLLIKNGLDPRLTPKQQEELTKAVEEPNKINLDPKDKEKLKEYILGQQKEKDNTRIIQPKNDQNESILLDSKDTNSLKSYVNGTKVNQQADNKMKVPDLDYYIVLLKESLENKVPFPENFISQGLKDQILKELDTRKEFQLDPKYNEYTVKQVSNQVKTIESMKQQGIKIPVHLLPKMIVNKLETTPQEKNKAVDISPQTKSKSLNVSK